MSAASAIKPAALLAYKTGDRGTMFLQRDRLDHDRPLERPGQCRRDLPRPFGSISEGKLRGLALLSDKRMDELPV